MTDKYPWSQYQLDFFEEVTNGTNHVVVEAVAGAGKTSTIIEGLERMPTHLSALLAAFNKRIAQELKLKAPQSADCRTLHSLGLRSLSRKFKDVNVETGKVDQILDDLVGKNKKLWDVKRQLKKTVSLAKGYLAEGDEFIDMIIDQHEIDTDPIGTSKFIEYVQDCLYQCALDVENVDFDDMIWLPYVHKVPVQKYDVVFLDECQDVNNCQIELTLKAVKRGGRVFALGDSRQAIYSFRGANSNSMELLRKRLKAKKMPLSITYRCPIKVTQEAQKYVPHMEHAPDAKEGIVDHINESQLMKAASPGCVILSRTNAPLVPFALSFLKKGIPANVLGKDIGDNLLNLIKKSRRKKLDAFLDWLENWEKKEVNRLVKKGRRTDNVQDKAECLRALADSCSSLPELKTKIIDIFEDTTDEDRVMLSTTHKFKGMEREVVYLLWGTYRGDNREERNIKYVAVSRSAMELYYVT